jgi:hypothetical protein
VALHVAGDLCIFLGLSRLVAVQSCAAYQRRALFRLNSSPIQLLEITLAISYKQLLLLNKTLYQYGIMVYNFISSNEIGVWDDDGTWLKN